MAPVRTYHHFYVNYCFARLQDKVALDLECFFGTDVFDLILIVVAKNIEAQAVTIGINELFQLVLQQFELAIVKHAFKNRVLYPRAVGDALLGDHAQAASAGGGRCVDIIGDQDKHIRTSKLLP